MNFAESVAPASSFRLVFGLLLAVVIGLIAAPQLAHAQSYRCTSYSPIVCDQGEAFAEASAHARQLATNNTPHFPIPCVRETPGSYVGSANGGSCQGNSVGTQTFYFQGLCASRLDGDTGMVNGTLTASGVCNKGCKMLPNFLPGGHTMREIGGANAINIRRGTWKASGDVCDPAAMPAQPDKKDEYCHTTASGHTVCKGKDKTCVTSVSGFRTCAPDDGNNGHTEANKSRTEAASISAPNTPPNPPTNRPGEDWKPSGGGTTITNNTTNNTTTTNNYSNGGTSNTGNPTPGDGSTPGGGSGGGEGGEGEGDKDSHGTVGGNGECKGSFTCTGGDPVLCAIAQQTYKARCEADGRWGDGDGDGSFPGDGDGGAGPDPDPKKAVKSAMPRLSMLDDGGFFGGGSCPQIPSISTTWGSFEFNNNDFCKLLGVARGALILLGAFVALGILMGWQGRD